MTLAATISAATSGQAQPSTEKKEPVLGTPQAEQASKTYETGLSEGHAAARTRISAVVGAEALKGNASATLAAVDLALKSPEMAATDVVSFVTDHLPAAADAGTSTSAASLDTRQAAAGSDPLAGVRGVSAQEAKKSGWKTAMSRSGAHSVVKS